MMRRKPLGTVPHRAVDRPEGPVFPRYSSHRAHWCCGAQAMAQQLQLTLQHNIEDVTT
jgi:hypothetical protein